jgi:hypothetical protein
MRLVVKFVVKFVVKTAVEIKRSTVIYDTAVLLADKRAY